MQLDEKEPSRQIVQRVLLRKVINGRHEVQALVCSLSLVDASGKALFTELSS